MPARNKRSSKSCEFHGKTVAVEAGNPRRRLWAGRLDGRSRVLICHLCLLSFGAADAASHKWGGRISGPGEGRWKQSAASGVTEWPLQTLGRGGCTRGQQISSRARARAAHGRGDIGYPPPTYWPTGAGGTTMPELTTRRSNAATVVASVYLAIATLLFIWMYFIAGVREMGLYVGLMAVAFPSSAVVVPASEKAADALGWPLGGPAHVIATQIVCTVANAFLFWLAVRVLEAGKPPADQGSGTGGRAHG